MTINRIRAAAATLIAFNLLGTFLTCGAHLQRARTGDAHAVANGTQFTGPLILVGIAIAAVRLLTMRDALASVR